MTHSVDDSPAKPVELETPILLLAMPQVLDPFFQKSVVLLLDHTEEGSVGFIINRPTELRLHEVLEDTEIDWPTESDPPAYFGGPVQLQLGTVLFDQTEETAEETAEETTSPPIGGDVEHGRLHGLGITHSLEDLQRLARRPPRAFRFFLGYAGWGAGQLIEEMMRNDWVTAPVQDELLFAEDPENSWDAALRAIGIEPSSLVSVSGAETN